ncbi:hypothetical protein K0M31_007731 [Melipona bicolor]|uniref:Mitochondrial transcription rescue factor 1 C-terminal domain-containing protein n=1 Tax=Melipona bicolor TaxID=60889 RepID=A0AA40GC93_9HYME|nr:hypothetical protein K0M31_007731 [Melipona bicolor]
MLCRTVFNIIRRTECINTQMSCALRSVLKLNSTPCNLLINCSYSQNLNSIIFVRFKSKGNISRKGKDEESDEESDEDDFETEIGTKVIEVTVPSLRLDVIAKSGFGKSRAQLDKIFYNSNLRLNGKKCLKKATMVQIGDEIDHIQERSPKNPEYLIINRCVLKSVSVDPETDTIKVKLAQNKSLLIEDYTDK